MKTSGSIILTKKHRKMTDDQNNVITKQTELINHKKQFREKLNIIDSKSDELQKEKEILKIKVSVTDKTH